MPISFISVLSASSLKIGSSSPVLPTEHLQLLVQHEGDEVKENLGKVEVDSGICVLLLLETAFQLPPVETKHLREF